MKKLMSLFVIATLVSLLFSSCKKKDDDITPTEGDNFDVELIMAEGDASKNVNVTVDANTQATIKEMERVYITQNIGGAGETVYEVTEEVSLKGDKSIDVSNQNKHSLEYIINLPVPTGVTGNVVYTIWATKGNGDHRKTDKITIVGPVTITLNYGGTNGAANVKSYTATVLAAPLADFSSKTFVSLTNGNTYAGTDGVEFAALWDFGYFNSGSEYASLASASGYEEAFKNNAGNSVYDVDVLTGTPQEDLNHCYFATSTMDFTAVTTSSDLSGITASATEEINNLSVGDVIQFVDNYGKKGLIKVIEINGTFNAGDSIKIAIKVQP